MSLIAVAASPDRRLSAAGRRVLIAALALAAVGLALAVLGWAAGAWVGATVPPKSPFGAGLREGAAGATGIGGWILAVQSAFYQSLTGALGDVRRGGGSGWALIGIGFLYGVFHAAGPGHGKGVIAGYLLATKRTLAIGLALSLAAALVQALVAIALVGTLAAILNASAATMNSAANAVELVSFGALAVLGFALLWRKTGRIAPGQAVSHNRSDAHAAHDHAGPSHAHHDHVCDAHCGHVHVPPASAVASLRTVRESAGVVLAAGIRPCSGAIILLVFALSQGLFALGIGATVAMALGTAITTGALAAVAVLAKGVALRLAAAQGHTGEAAVAWLEVLAAAFVAVLGLALLGGAWSGGLPS